MIFRTITDDITLAAKAQSAAFKLASTAINIVIFTLVAKGVGLVINKVDDYIHRVEKAKEAMQDADEYVRELRENDRF